ncbi:MAG: DEAD/DEAH box helicase, partial [Anaerovorax sp.]
METFQIKDQITTLKGVGPKKSHALRHLGIETIEDLLRFYPREYEDRRNVKTIHQLCHGEKAVVQGEIQRMVKSKSPVKKKQTLTLFIKDPTGTMELVFFNAPYLDKTLSQNVKYEFYGMVTIKFGKIQMIQPAFNKATENKKNGILPIYPLTKGLWQREMRKWQEGAKPYITHCIDYLPQETIKRKNLCSLSYALHQIHFPENGRKLKEAKYRLIFDELFLLQLGLLSLRARNEAQLCGIEFSKHVDFREFFKTFPYAFTKAQQRVVAEINRDMESKKVMHRLVQGDVGSGKTAVAATAIYKAIKNGYQAVLMAPTEILARQHYEGFLAQFKPLGISVGFLGGSLKAKEKQKVLMEIETGTLDLVIGTHAIIQPTVNFFKLGLVVTDEQHRFGVNQRAALRQKGENPHILVMTATPIPRTLAVVLYGDLDISIIDEMPPGRQTIITKSAHIKERDSVY